MHYSQTSSPLPPPPEKPTGYLTCERMLVHCCNKETGGLPILVASWTLSNCSFWVEFSCRAWARATAAHQFESESVENKPPHNN